MIACRHHCAGCGGHFSSLEAFDSHQPRSGGCGWPDDAPLVELTGVCKVANYNDNGEPIANLGVSVHQHPNAARARDFFGSRAGAENGSNGSHSAPARPRTPAREAA
jgi:hypothetical protein